MLAGIALVFPLAATVSVAAAGINGVLYSAEGEYTSAAFSFFSATPVFAVSGWVSKEGVKVLNKVNNITSKIKFPTGAVDEVGNTLSKSMESWHNSGKITTKYDNMSWNQIKVANQTYDNAIEITVKPLVGTLSSLSSGNYTAIDSMDIFLGLPISTINIMLSNFK